MPAPSRNTIILAALASLTIATAAFTWSRNSTPPPPPQPPAPDTPLLHPQHLDWYKGNLHTHTWWSDGDSPPEIAIQWYQSHDYNFLLLTEHNVLMEGEHWFYPYDHDRKKAAELYEKTFPGSFEKRKPDLNFHYRLRTLAELRRRFEQTGRFALLQGEEITDHLGDTPVHLNAFHLAQLVPPQGGSSIREILQHNLQAVQRQRISTGQPMLTFINHPNFGWALKPEDIAPIPEARFFEVYNGHQGTRNHGDPRGARLSTERLWDIVLTERLAKYKLPLLYGIATDDAHMYVDFPKLSNPGRGWVMVLSSSLNAADLAKALESGAFYASSGVTISRISFSDQTLRIEIQAKDGVIYSTRFIGTLKGEEDKPAHVGKLLSEQEGPVASYRMSGLEWYVRAQITSSTPHPNPHREGDREEAWIQPITREFSSPEGLDLRPQLR